MIVIFTEEDAFLLVDDVCDEYREEVKKLISSIGFNRLIRFMHKATKEIMEDAEDVIVDGGQVATTIFYQLQKKYPLHFTAIGTHPLIMENMLIFIHELMEGISLLVVETGELGDLLTEKEIKDLAKLSSAGIAVQINLDLLL